MSYTARDYNFSMHMFRLSNDHKIKSGSIWCSDGSSLAVAVVTVTNSSATDIGRYPETIVFLDQGKLKSLTVSEFTSKYKRVMTGDCPDIRLELSHWIHDKSGTTYTVLLRTSEDDPLIVYTDRSNTWSRRASDWDRSMSRIK